MRVYVPSSTSLLRTLVTTGSLADLPLTAFAVTPALREWYVDEDVEELEYAAMSEAARASLRLLDADEAAVRRRVVIAADVPDSAIAVRDEVDRGVVHVNRPVAMADIASVHMDDTEAEQAVTRAAASILAADLGDQEAQDAVDDVEGFELSWYASQEIGPIVELL